MTVPTVRMMRMGALLDRAGPGWTVLMSSLGTSVKPLLDLPVDRVHLIWMVMESLVQVNKKIGILKHSMT